MFFLDANGLIPIPRPQEFGVAALTEEETHHPLAVAAH